MKKLFRMALMMSAAAVSFTVASCGGGGGGGGGGYVLTGYSPANLEGYTMKATADWSWEGESTWKFVNGQVTIEGTISSVGGTKYATIGTGTYTYKRDGDTAKITITKVPVHRVGTTTTWFVIEEATVDLKFVNEENATIVYYERYTQNGDTLSFGPCTGNGSFAK